jgi:glycosyltransferase involved in cell wall biosynthesis
MTDVDTCRQAGAPRHVLVVVPANDERADLEGALDAIAVACDRVADRVSSSIVVVADACTDGTETIALRHPAVDLTVTTNKRSAGAARRIGTDVGLAASPQRLAHTWIASTDGDSRVPTNWLGAQLLIANRGAVGVAGTVELRSDGCTDHALSRRFTLAYDAGIDGSHRHVHGANMGFRANAYRAAGGWCDLVTGEDHDLWHRLRAVGSVVSSTAIIVATSSRRRGRAPRGFAADLAALDEGVA